MILCCREFALASPWCRRTLPWNWNSRGEIQEGKRWRNKWVKKYCGVPVNTFCKCAFPDYNIAFIVDPSKAPTRENISTRGRNDLVISTIKAFLCICWRTKKVLSNNKRWSSNYINLFILDEDTMEYERIDTAVAVILVFMMSRTQTC